MKRFLLSFLIVAITLAAVMVPVSADYTLPQYIRVGLLYGNSAPKSVTLQSEYGFRLGDYDGRTFVEDRTVSDTTVVVKNEGGTRIIVTNSSGQTLYAGNQTAGILPAASGKNQIIAIDGISYRGGVHCIGKNDRMHIVNVVFFDHYLYGVISREMSPSWHIEALKAQAVCARNYAANNLDKHGKDGFDLCSGVHCQAYDGIKFETEGSYAPVDDTTRQVLTYGGKLAELYYSSSMGDTTEDVQYVWGNSVPYLRSVDNSFEDTANIPNGVWTGTITCDEASAIMRNKGYDVGTVTQIKVLEYSPNGRVVKMEVVGTTKSKVFEREACRTIFNTVTKSQMFTVEGDGEGGKNIPTISVTDGTNTKNQSVDKVVMLTAGGRAVLESNILYVSNGIYQKTYEITQTEIHPNSKFTFQGIGWGHGVGMSQYGAKGMAEAGYSYVDILLHYFVGTNLENVYE